MPDRVGENGLSPAAHAFDSIAERFDERFSPWLSVAAQRRPVRAALARAFPVGSSLLDIGGGTGEEAEWLTQRGRRVLMTDASPAMVRVAGEKLRAQPLASTQVMAAEDIGAFADAHDRSGAAQFDGAYSNFAALNCVVDLAPFAHGLARVLKPGAAALLVVFGTACPGEVVVEAARLRPRNMFRRAARGAVPARLSGRAFTVRYHRRGDFRAAMAPWFDLVGRQGIGVFVPPSAAEPWISRYPRLIAGLEAADRLCSRPLAVLGDHVLYHFVRTAEPA